jgi:hypothetical protein
MLELGDFNLGPFGSVQQALNGLLALHFLHSLARCWVLQKQSASLGRTSIRVEQYFDCLSLDLMIGILHHDALNELFGGCIGAGLQPWQYPQNLRTGSVRPLYCLQGLVPHAIAPKSQDQGRKC